MEDKKCIYLDFKILHWLVKVRGKDSNGGKADGRAWRWKFFSVKYLPLISEAGSPLRPSLPFSAKTLIQARSLFLCLLYIRICFDIRMCICFCYNIGWLSLPVRQQLISECFVIHGEFGIMDEGISLFYFFYVFHLTFLAYES